MIELVITQPGKPERRMLLKGGAYAVGRHPQADIVLDDKAVSRHHARLLVDGDVAVLQDLDSGSGTFVDGDAVREARLSDGIHVEITPFTLTVATGVIAEAPTVPTLLVTAGSDVGRMFDLEEDELTIGRGDDADLKLDDTGASRMHALLVRRKGEWYVRDLGSANGLFINDQQVGEGPLEPGDELAIGNTVLVLGERETDGKPTVVRRPPASRPTIIPGDHELDADDTAQRPRPAVAAAPPPAPARPPAPAPVVAPAPAAMPSPALDRPTPEPAPASASSANLTLLYVIVGVLTVLVMLMMVLVGFLLAAPAG